MEGILCFFIRQMRKNRIYRLTQQTLLYTTEINFNANLNEDPENIYSIYYPTVAGRVVESKATLSIENKEDGLQTLYLKPLDPGIVFQKIIVDFGGYQKSHLFMNESPCRREK